MIVPIKYFHVEFFYIQKLLFFTGIRLYLFCFFVLISEGIFIYSNIYSIIFIYFLILKFFKLKILSL